jgi:hypothetical protein
MDRRDDESVVFIKVSRLSKYHLGQTLGLT